MYAKILQNLAKENDFLLASAVDVLKTYFATKTCAKKLVLATDFKKLLVS